MLQATEHIVFERFLPTEGRNTNQSSKSKELSITDCTTVVLEARLTELLRYSGEACVLPV